MNLSFAMHEFFFFFGKIRPRPHCILFEPTIGQSDAKDHTRLSPPSFAREERRTSDCTRQEERETPFKQRGQKCVRSSRSPFCAFLIVFLVIVSGMMMALGSRIVDGTSRDRDCECRCGETLNSTTTLRHLFVGEPEKCAKEECELKFPETCFSTQFVEATFVSCLCSCGGHPLVENLFESEDSSECTEAACATRFSEVCPGIASETSDNENFATFLDCSCGCQTSGIQ